MATTMWVIAADASRARIFERAPQTSRLEEIEDVPHPEGSLQNREIDTDGHGRFYGKGERHQGHTAERDVSATDKEMDRFAKELAERLETARAQNRYGRLCLIAPPKFLGLLRRHLSSEAHKLIEREIHKDLSKFDARDIEPYLPVGAE